VSAAVAGGDRDRTVPHGRGGSDRGRCITNARRDAGENRPTSPARLYRLLVLAKGFNVFYLVLLTGLYGQAVHARVVRVPRGIRVARRLTNFGPGVVASEAAT
jgi:hypothetical protein